MRTEARAALDAARAAAAIARQDASAENVAAVRAAIAGALGWRWDAVTVAPGGVGYNPYRDTGGKFAPGAHKQRPTAGDRAAAAVGKAKERVAKAAERVAVHGQKLAGAHEARHAAIAETRAALGKARDAALLARNKPTAKNVKAAQVATNKATRAQAKVGKHEAAIGKHTAAHAKATTAHARAVDAHAKAHARTQETKAVSRPRTGSGTRTKLPDPAKVAEAVASDPRRALVAADLVPAPRSGQALSNAGHLEPAARLLYKDQWSPEGQAAARDHTVHMISQYGMYHKEAGLIGAHTFEIRTDHGMPGADGLHWNHNGQTAIHQSLAADVQEHAQLNARGLHDLGARHLSGDADAAARLNSHRVVVHEEIHGHGPSMIRTGPHTFVEEVTTEMAARKVSADVHGLHTADMEKAGTYHEWTKPTIAKLSELSGKSIRDSHEALARSAIEFKRGKDKQLSPTDAMRQVGNVALRELGVRGSKAQTALYDHMTETARANP